MNPSRSATNEKKGPRGQRSLEGHSYWLVRYGQMSQQHLVLMLCGHQIFLSLSQALISIAVLKEGGVIRLVGCTVAGNRMNVTSTETTMCGMRRQHAEIFFTCQSGQVSP